MQPRAQRAPRGRILDAALFTTAMTREQKRVDRSDKAFAVLTVELTDGCSAELMREAAAAMAISTRASDIIGWLRRDEAIGVLLTETCELNFAQMVNVESRIRRELADVCRSS